MNYAECLRLFMLFAGLEDPTPYLPLLDAAYREVTLELRPDADDKDTRLCYYCAAVANLRYMQLIAMKSDLFMTPAGTMAKQRDNTVPCGFAERLVYQFRAAAADLLIDRCFVFTGIR